MTLTDKFEIQILKPDIIYESDVNSRLVDVSLWDGITILKDSGVELVIVGTRADGGRKEQRVKQDANGHFIIILDKALAEIDGKLVLEMFLVKGTDKLGISKSIYKVVRTSIDEKITDLQTYLTYTELEKLYNEIGGKIDKVLADKTKAMDTLITDKGKVMDKLVTDKTATLNSLITSKSSDLDTLKSTKSTELNTLLTTKQTELTALLTDLQTKVDNGTIKLESAMDKKYMDDTVKKAVDDIQIGGRNLYVESDTINGYIDGTGTSVNIISTETPQHRTMTTWYDVVPNEEFIYQVWNPNKVVNSNSNRIMFVDSNNVATTKFMPPTLNGTSYQIFKFKAPPNSVKMLIGVIQGLKEWDKSIRIKVERGNKPTDYTLAYEDISSYTKIGMRNYVLGSNEFPPVASQRVSSSSAIKLTVTPEKYLNIVSDGTGQYHSGWSSAENCLLINENFAEGEWFVFTMWIKKNTPESTGIPRIYFKAGMGYYVMTGDITTEWSRIYYIGKWKKSGGVLFHLNWGGIIGSFTIKSFSFIKGNSVPLDWIPAIESLGNNDAVTKLIADSTTASKNYTDTEVKKVSDNLTTVKTTADKASSDISNLNSNFNSKIASYDDRNAIKKESYIYTNENSIGFSVGIGKSNSSTNMMLIDVAMNGYNSSPPIHLMVQLYKYLTSEDSVLAFKQYNITGELGYVTYYTLNGESYIYFPIAGAYMSGLVSVRNMNGIYTNRPNVITHTTSPLSDSKITFKKQPESVRSNINNTNLLSSILAVDGKGSGLDSDLFDGIDSSRFVYKRALGNSTTPNEYKQENNIADGELYWSFLGNGNTGYAHPYGTILGIFGDWSYSWQMQFGDGDNVWIRWANMKTNSWSEWKNLVNPTRLASKPASDYALKSDIPSLTNYATKSYVSEEVTRAVSGGTVDLTGYLPTVNLKTELLKIDGSGSGLDADLLDGKDSTAFALKTDLTSLASKSDIPSLTNYALKTDIPSLSGYATTSSLSAYAKATDLTAYAKTTDLSSYAKATDLANYVSSSSLTTTLGGYVKTTDLSSYVKTTDLSTYAKTADLSGYVKTSDTTYAKKADIPSLTGYALKSEIPSLTDYALKSEIPTVPSLTPYLQTANLKTELLKIDGSGSTLDADLLDGVDGSLYARKTDIPSLTNYALKTDIPSLSGYATTASLSSYVTSTSLTSTLSSYAKTTDLSSYAKTTDLSGYVKTTDTTYAKKTDIPTVPSLTPYLQTANLKTELLKIDGSGSTLDADLLDGVDGSAYARKTDLNSYATVSSLSSYATLTDISTVANNLPNGIYNEQNKNTTLMTTNDIWLDGTGKVGKISTINRTTGAITFAPQMQLAKITQITQSAYDALSTKDANMLYLIIG